jgi:hypothetical protein
MGGSDSDDSVAEDPTIYNLGTTFTSTGTGQANPVPTDSSDPGDLVTGGDSGVFMPISFDPDPCPGLLAALQNLVNAVRQSGTNAFKGLMQRYNQLPNLPNSQLFWHVQQFQNQQINLGRKIQQYEDEGCGDPPSGISQWVNMPLQPIVQQRLDLINLLNTTPPPPQRRVPPGYWILPVIPVWLEWLLGGLVVAA